MSCSNVPDYRKREASHRTCASLEIETFLGINVEKNRKNHLMDPNEKAEKAENNLVHRRRSKRHAMASLGCKSEVAVSGSTAYDRVATTDSTNPS